MMYWRDPDTGDVIKTRPGAPEDPGDVQVISAETWRRMEGAKSLAAAAWGLLCNNGHVGEHSPPSAIDAIDDYLGRGDQ